MTKGLLIAALAVMPMIASAADAPADAAAAPVDSLAPPACTQPEIPSAAAALDDTATRTRRKDSKEDFQKAYQAYGECMKAYVNTQADLSKRHITAANAAVKTLNDYNAKLNAQNN